MLGVTSQRFKIDPHLHDAAVQQAMREFYVDRAIRMKYAAQAAEIARVATERPSSDGTRDGVYVDCSIHKHKPRSFLGFVVRRAGIVSVFSTHGFSRSSSEAEREAVQIAQAIYPGIDIYCDYDVAASRPGVNWIDRRYNKEAHRAARTSKNFIERHRLERLVGDTILPVGPGGWVGRGCAS